MAIHRFGDFTLDESSQQLTRGDAERVELSGRAFDLLAMLLRHRGEVMTRARLLDAVWQDSEVTDSALSQTLFLVRRALGPEGHQLIRTVSGRGYCIDLPPPAEAIGAMPAEEASAASDPPPAEALPVEAAAVPRSRRPLLWLAAGLCAVIAVVAITLRFTPASKSPASPLAITLAMAPEASASDAWTLSALRGVLRTGLNGNLDILIAEGARPASLSPGRSSLTGVIRIEPGGIPRRVAVAWTWEPVDGRRQRWRDSAPADRLFDLATRAQERLRGFDPTLALAGIGQMTGPVPESALLSFARGIDEQAQNHPADAAANFEAALQAYPDLTLARLELAKALIEQGYRTAALSHLSQVDRTLAMKTDTSSIALRASSRFLARDFAAAGKTFDVLVAAHPEVLPWRMQAAQAHGLAGNGPEALALLAPLDPQRLSARWAVDYYKMRAIALSDPAQALAAVRLQLQESQRLREPELEAEAHLHLARLLYKNINLAAATAEATRALAAAERGKSNRARLEARQFQVGLRMFNEQPVTEKELAQLLEAARSTGDIYREGAVELILANDRFRRLDLDGAIAHRQRALQLLERGGDRNGIDTALQSLFGLERLRGNREAALGWLRRLEADAESSPAEPWQTDYERSRGTIWSGFPGRAAAELQATRRAMGESGTPMDRAALACLQGQAAVLAGDPAAAFAPLDDCDAAIADAVGKDAPGVEQRMLSARAQLWRAIAARAAGRPADAARALRAAETGARAVDGYRTVEMLGELALAAALVDEPAQARTTLAWIVGKPEVGAAALPRAMLHRAQCTLARREGDANAKVCIEAEAAAKRIGHPLLRLGVAP